MRRILRADAAETDLLDLNSVSSSSPNILRYFSYLSGWTLRLLQLELIVVRSAHH
jgi:hypothetical protein